jgi:hypothetical protein
MTAPIPYDYDLYWQQLEHGHADWPANQAMPGFYRKRERNGTKVGVAIWVGNDGRPVVKVGKAAVEALTTTSREAEFCEYAFAWIAKHPVTEESYRAWLTTGVWHDDVPEADVDPNAPPHVVVKETIADLLRQAEAWLAEIGGEVKTQEQADKAANFADRFHELAKESETKREVEKKPHLDAGREIDARWKEITDAGKSAKKWANGLTDAFLKAERARKLAEAARAAEAGEAVRDADVKVRAGTRGRGTGLRKSEQPHVTDMTALIEHYRNDARFWKRPMVCAELGALANLDTKAGGTVPGFTIRLVESAA